MIEKFCRCCGGQIIGSAHPHLCAECVDGKCSAPRWCGPAEAGTANEGPRLTEDNEGNEAEAPNNIVQIVNPFGGGWDE